MSDRLPVPRTVRPRNDADSWLPIVVHTNDTSDPEGNTIPGCVFVERTAEVHRADQLPALIATEPSSIFVCHNAPIIVKELDLVFDKDPRWQFRASPVEREVWKPNRESYTVYRETVINFFGFTDKKKKKVSRRYFYPLDPLRFIRKSIFDIRGADDEHGPSQELQKLYEWALEVRDFIVSNGLRIAPTSGGLAAQLLRDKRFYPEPRRKVPKATNAVSRIALPGNFYQLYSAREGLSNDATYLDQVNAHHSAAKDISFPHSDNLYARGYFLDYAKGEYRDWLTKGSSAFDRFRSQHRGLILARIHAAHMPKVSFHLPCMNKAGYSDAFLFTNEWEYLESFEGSYVDCIYASWTSTRIDKGLNLYANWATEQILNSDPLRKNWLKPLLLATYGILASRPRAMEVGYKRAKGGKLKYYPAGKDRLQVLAKQMSKERELGIVNVIHRGMVEAETRLRSLKLAQQLYANGNTILAVYADSVFVGADKPLPFLPDPWRIQEHLTALRFYSPTSFVSKEITKLPGVPKDKQMMIARAREVLAVKPTGRLPSFRIPREVLEELEAMQAGTGIYGPDWQPVS